MEVATPEEEDFNGRLLHQSALWDNAELLEDLLRGDQLSNMNSQDSWGRTPLHAAATTENSTCLRILLQAGGNHDNNQMNLFIQKFTDLINILYFSYNFVNFHLLRILMACKFHSSCFDISCSHFEFSKHDNRSNHLTNREFNKTCWLTFIMHVLYDYFVSYLCIEGISVIIVISLQY
ncbi:hypothetical protein O3M35_008713 [Rhynocoris fuscipes]|uniref:ANK_REP_REGION domain-containing protein n=1 Tax=Rhynocoris fuscipes TaxID=488301 RepID=A0AAW1D8R5_9HEMI